MIACAQDFPTGLAPVVAAAGLFPKGEVAVIDDCGHCQWVEQPDAFRAAADPFVVWRPVRRTGRLDRVRGPVKGTTPDTFSYLSCRCTRTSRYGGSLLPTGVRMPADDIDGVVDGLAGIVRDARRDGDRVGYFAALYRQVTVEVRTAIHSGLFDDGPRMDRFDTVFGNRYFEAHDAWRRDRSGPTCWREVFGLLHDEDTVIVQHLVLGVSAHIGLDLAVAAARTAPGDAIHGLRRDFLLINDILARVVLAVQRSVGAVSPLLWLLDEVGGRTDGRVLDFSIRRSREEAWHNAVLLAGQDESEQAGTIELLDVRAAVLARLIARPGGLVRPALELIRNTESDDVPSVIAHLDRAMASTAE